MTTGAAGRRRADDGAAGLLTVLASLLCATVCLALVVVAADVGVAAARARTAADAAALAAAGASPLAGGDGDDRGAAHRLAVANGARLVACCHVPASGHGTDVPALVVVEVEVRLPPRAFRPGGGAIRARAGAGLRPADVAVARVRPAAGRVAKGEQRTDPAAATR